MSPQQLPGPIAAALGVVSSVLEPLSAKAVGRARGLATAAVATPMTAVSRMLAGGERLRERYEQFATLGAAVVDGHRKQAEERANGVALRAAATAKQRTDEARSALEKAGSVIEARTGRRRESVTTAVENTLGRVEVTLKAPSSAADEAAAAAPSASEPAIDEPPTVEVDTSPVSPLEGVELPATSSPGATLSHDELPLADYDHQTLGQLRGRLRTLTIEQLTQLRDYERAHASRIQVLTLFENRLAKLAAQSGPAGGDPGPAQPDAADPVTRPAAAATPAGADATPPAAATDPAQAG